MGCRCAGWGGAVGSGNCVIGGGKKRGLCVLRYPVRVVT